MIFLIYSGYKNHINLVITPSTRLVFEDKLKDYKTGKGSIKLSYGKLLPKNLIQAMAKYRTDEYRKRGIKWM